MNRLANRCSVGTLGSVWLLLTLGRSTVRPVETRLSADRVGRREKTA
ncbi:MAG: hypothetical protein ACI8TP_003219 [Acidimicrobiales bacterium]|jgi:hypothetical protein